MRREADFVDSPMPRQRVAQSRYGMVATAHDKATEAGVEMMEAGGNAFDAAIAAAFALGVCEHQASGLGGQSMALYHDAGVGETVALDGSSYAPERATPEAVPIEQRESGYRATTVPSTPAVLADLLQRKGTLSLADVMNPSLRLAEEGYRISNLQHMIQKDKHERLLGTTAAPFFLKGGKRVLQRGDVHVQETLARTLHGLQVRGLEDFYHGEVGRSIVRDMKRNDGLITARDLARVPWPVARKADLGRWQRQSVATFPPPGAGRVLLELLHVMDRTPERYLDPETPRGAVFLARAMRQALRDHDEEPRDPARHQMTPHEMIAQDHARLLALRLRRGLRGGETTHLSVMDREGNAVGITQSIELFYGACVATPELGFLYNNYMSACHDDPRHPYSLRPFGVPWSSVAPAIVFKRGKPTLIIGSPGSDRIATSVAQVMLRLRNNSPMEAVEAPRMHARPDGTATLETPRFSQDVPKALEEDGFNVVNHDAFSRYHGCVQLVMRKRGRFIGVADPRRDGSAGGPRAGTSGREEARAATRRGRRRKRRTGEPR